MDRRLGGVELMGEAKEEGGSLVGGFEPLFYV